jgi:hypothetical protein
MSFKVVFNAGYGGFDMNDDALTEFNKRASKHMAYPEMIDRTDPVLIEMVEEMGDQMNQRHSTLKIAEFPLPYKDFLKWDESDGKEAVSIDFNRYIVFHIKKITEDDDDMDHQKMSRIYQLLYETEQDQQIAISQSLLR